MARILAIDYGIRRTGLAVTDSLQKIATALRTLPTETLIPFLKTYHAQEKVEQWVVGWPKKMNGQDSDIAPLVQRLVNKLKQLFPAVPVALVDERLTSKIARRAMVESGLKKKDRQKKEKVDQISAVLILQSYLAAR